MTKYSRLLLPLVASLVLSCWSIGLAKDAAYDPRFGAPASFDQSVHMQPLQPGQPPQKPDRSISKVPAVQGGRPGAPPLPFNQPFVLTDLEYQFMAAKGKDYVGLDSNPAMRPPAGDAYFLVRYQVINHGRSTATVRNTAAVHLFDMRTKQVTDINPAATNANVMSGAATGLPDRLMLEPERPQIQTLVFEVPSSTNVGQLAVLVTDPKDPKGAFQMLRLSN